MKHHCNRDLFVSELNDLLNNPEIQRMAGYEQHQGNTTLQHVLNVAMVSFRIADRLGLDIDERALAKGAVLHDFYLYNIPETGLSDYRHGVSHPELAVRNAKKVMEAVVVMMADKYCAVREMVFRKKTV